MRTLAALFLICAIAAVPADAARRTKKHHAPKKPVVFTVTPSDEIEERVTAESEKAKNVLEDLRSNNLFDSPYLTAAIYYHDGFLSDFPDEKPDADPARRIVARLQRDLTVDKKADYVRLLLQYWCDTAPYADALPERFVIPVPYEPPAPPPKPRKSFRWRRARRGLNHEFAIDLFTNEGTPSCPSRAGSSCSRIAIGCPATHSPRRRRRAATRLSSSTLTPSDLCDTPISIRSRSTLEMQSAPATPSAQSATPA